MDFWAYATAIVVVVMIAEVIKTKYQSQARDVQKRDMTKLHEAVSKMQVDLDEIKDRLNTVVIQLDDFKSKT